MMDYLNPALSSEERTEDLLKRMTLREKVGQLNQRLYGFSIYERNGDEFEVNDYFREEVEKWGGLGTLYGLYRADPWADKNEETGITPKLSRKAYNTVQKYVIEHSRFGIPMLLSTECPHGHQALGGGLLPVNPAAGATFDEKLLEDAYEACGKQLRDGHVDFALMSVLDVLRDPRWGRSEECYSEDPVLSARMAKSAIKGMQKTGVSAVAKHLCAQGECTGGVNASAARIGERELREIHLQSMAACCEVGVQGVMAAYNEVDGVFCHANPHLLRDILRDEMGFKGVVMADGFAVDSMDDCTGDRLLSGSIALKSGVDISLWDLGFTCLEQAVEQGYVDEAYVDEACRRVLKLKFDRGLFENPYMDTQMQEEEAYGIDKFSYQIAKESVVMLKNNGVLPIKKDTYNRKKVAIIGANADEMYSMLGDYTPPRDPKKAVTILQGLQMIYGEDVEFDYLDKKWDEVENNPNFDATVYDVALVVGGGSSSRFGGATFDINGAAIAGEVDRFAMHMECGEGMDCASLSMPGNLEERTAKYFAGKIPVVFVAIAGRPYALEEMDKLSDAVLYSFYPGPYGGKASAEIIAGQCNPTGRLPVSIPRHCGQVPVYYNYKESYKGMKYCDTPQGALYTFGDGLSYGSINYSDVAVTYGVDEVTGDKHAEVTFTVENAGNMPDAAIPQLYIHRVGGCITARIKELKNFARVELAPGEKKQVTLELKEKDFRFYDYAIKHVSNAKKYDLYLSDRGILHNSTQIIF